MYLPLVPLGGLSVPIAVTAELFWRAEASVAEATDNEAGSRCLRDELSLRHLRATFGTATEGGAGLL